MHFSATKYHDDSGHAVFFGVAQNQNIYIIVLRKEKKEVDIDQPQKTDEILEYNKFTWIKKKCLFAGTYFYLIKAKNHAECARIGTELRTTTTTSTTRKRTDRESTVNVSLSQRTFVLNAQVKPNTHTNTAMTNELGKAKKSCGKGICSWYILLWNLCFMTFLRTCIKFY